MTNGRAAAVYSLVLPFAAGATLVIGGWIMDVFHQIPRRPHGVTGWMLNAIPPVIVGVTVYYVLARLVGARRSSTHPVRAHVLRSVSLYVVALVLGVPIVHDISKPEFWQFGQLVLWVWLTAVGGIVTDALWAAYSVRTLTQTAVSTTSPAKPPGTS